jgi:hypothetical protein
MMAQGAAVQTLAGAARFCGILTLLVLAGCGGVKPPAPTPPPQSVAPQAPTETTVATSTPPASPSAPVSAAPVQSVVEPVAPNPNSPPVTPSVASSKAPIAAKAAPPSVKVPAVPTSPSPAPKSEVPAPTVAKPSTPPLDLTSLKERLKDTRAIGVLTKITLKNQVDDLLDQFRAFYQGKLKTTLADLRRSYELLVMKVLALLQDSDPPLATAIVASREQIWGILADPKKFATI